MTKPEDSAFIQFGLLPEVCIHSPMEDQYSHMYRPNDICDCGSREWIENDCTMLLGNLDGIPIYKDVHRCKKCNEVRLATHIGIEL